MRSRRRSSSRTAPSARSKGRGCALGRRNAFQWEINGSKGSLAFDMERLNELQVFRADGDRARGFKTVLVTETNHPFWEHWWPPGHIIGWGDTFVHELHHMLAGDRLGRRRGAVRRDVRGRLPRLRGRRRDRPLRAERAARDDLVPLAVRRTWFALRTRFMSFLGSSRQPETHEPGSQPEPGSGKHERRLAAAVVERLGEAVERHAEGDEALEHVRPALARPVERVDCREPVLPVRVDAAEDDAVLEHRIDASTGRRARPSGRARRCRAGRRRRSGAAGRALSAMSCAFPAASTTRSKPPASSGARRAAPRPSRRSARRARSTSCGSAVLERAVADVDALQPEQDRREHPDRARRRARARARAATAGGRRSRAHAGAPARRSTSARRARRAGRATRDGDELRRVLGDELAREAVEARDPALAVVAGEARVGRPLAAGEAVPARAAHGRGHEVARVKPWPSRSTTRERPRGRARARPRRRARRRTCPRRSRGRCRRRRPPARAAAPRPCAGAAARARRRRGWSGRRRAR